jgi:hypothetical protein
METIADKIDNLTKIRSLFEAGEKLTVITCYKKVSTFELKHYVMLLRKAGMAITDKWASNDRKRWKVYWLAK